MEKLRILFLCQQPLWPTNTGARLRNFHLANALSHHCEVSVLQAVDPSEKQLSPPFTSFQHVLSATRGRSYTAGKIIRGLMGPLPMTVLNYLSANVERVLLDTLEANRYDAVQIENIHMVPYLETIRRRFSLPVVLDWHNIESELIQQFGKTSANPAKSFVAARTGKLLAEVEERALGSFTAHTVVSHLDGEKLLKRRPDARIHVVPNGVVPNGVVPNGVVPNGVVPNGVVPNEVDTASFAFTPAETASRTLLFVGSMDYHANSEAVIWFCREIWPQLAAEFPNFDFKIVGRNPPAAVQALSAPRITVTGTVDDVSPFYRDSFAVIVPLRVGGGTRLKILEAMAAGVPVVSTRLGAEGIQAQDGVEILLADNAADMAASLRALMNQPDLARRLSDAARELVRTRYDWSVLGSQLAAIYQTLTSSS